MHTIRYSFFTLFIILSTFLITPTKTEAAATDCFQSAATGNWATLSTWQMGTPIGGSCTGVTWIAATSAPTNAATGISILNSHTVTMRATNIGTTAYTAKKLTIGSGGTLIHEVLTNTRYATLAISDDTGTDFVINGIYVVQGQAPTLNVGATGQVNTNGMIRVDSAIRTQGDDIAYSATNALTFMNGSIFQWNNTSAFETNNITYFPNASSGTIPIFQINKAVVVGAINTTTFNGKIEILTGTTATFSGAGSKIFRDGIGGAGTLIHDTTSGTFIINSNTAVIDGSITINLENNTNSNELEISGTTTISGTPQIKVGLLSSSGATLFVSGVFKNNAINSTDLTYGRLHITGSIDETSTGNFVGSNSSGAITEILIEGSSGGSAGSIKFNNISTYINDFTINRTGSNSQVNLDSSIVVEDQLVLTKGIITTGEHLLTATAGKITTAAPLSANYTDSYVATSTKNGSALTSVEGLTPTDTVPFNGDIGFRIIIPANQANNEVLFPVGADLVSANRMGIDMNGTATNITVVVGKGDLLNTPRPRVNRIWYTHATNTGNADMKLYFTKRNWYTDPFLIDQDEIETGYMFDDNHLVQKNYTNEFINNSLWPDDIVNFIITSNNTEIYAKYTVGISPDNNGVKNGINSFNKFSVVNANDIILGDPEGSLPNVNIGPISPDVTEAGTSTTIQTTMTNIGNYTPDIFYWYFEKTDNINNGTPITIPGGSTVYSFPINSTITTSTSYTFPSNDHGQTRYVRLCLENTTDTLCGSWKNIYINIPPIPNAGPNKSITLPTSSVSVSGTSTDTDGSIYGVKWLFINGPSGVTPIISPEKALGSSLTSNISGLTTAGIYTFRFYAKDNNGSVKSDLMAVQVN